MIPPPTTDARTNLFRKRIYAFWRTRLNRDEAARWDAELSRILWPHFFAFRVAILGPLIIGGTNVGELDQASVHIEEYGTPAVLG